MSTSPNDANIPYSVELTEEQKLPANGMFGALTTYGWCINTIPTGDGKTVVSLWLKQVLENSSSLSSGSVSPKIGEDRLREVKLVVIGPGSLAPVSNKRIQKGQKTQSPFQRETEKYNEYLIYISYETLRGSVPDSNPDSNSPKIVYSTTGKEMKNVGSFVWQKDEKKKHGSRLTEDTSDDEYMYTDYCWLVVRRDVKRKKGSKYEYIPEFWPSKNWMQFCMDYNVLLVIDESQKAKNKAAQNNSVAAMIRGIRRAHYAKGGGAYFTLNSATPLDKIAHGANYFNLIGMINPLKNKDMFINRGIRTGYQCYLEARLYDPIRSFEIAGSAGITNKREKDLNSSTNNQANLDMWLDCVMKKVNFSMVSMVKAQVYNGFFDVNHKEDVKLIEESHALLKSIKNINGKTLYNLGCLAEIKSKTETAMIRTISKQALFRLNDDPFCKVVIGFTRIESVNRCVSILSNNGYEDYIVKIAGFAKEEYPTAEEKSEKKNMKTKGISQFQASDDKRIIVGTLLAIATGIDLHDTQGGRQRWSYMPGDPDVTLEHQFAGRTRRYDTKSMPQVFLCYPKKLGPSILSVYDANIRKTGIMARSLKSRDLTGVDIISQRIYESQLKLPGQYNRFIELSGREDISYLMDNSVYNDITKEFYPQPDDFGFLGRNTEAGRIKYRDTEKVIAYLEKMREENVKQKNIHGFVFLGPMPNWVDPTQPFNDY